ncbi:sialidase family protein [Paenibacillus radicis (ex Xue et al. 2023)]|uniref:Glycoside hydrolase n=1 Tax=Paenibacillus radicis (ex Xue et al. 2023) TaxID=2972489 RepID=A0ABT1YHL0_9BACL|nr:sialidase family protein [Paenibacillus radicis (ex Xue et al. 2023)]MCR8632695.1 glycoside hydrolase [Paenibacillus radicis (ex Xue et al. 2023)]
MKKVSDSNKHLVAQEKDMYISFPGIAKAAKGALVACYLRTDSHHRTKTDIMITRSLDGGQSWINHQSISYTDVFEQGSVYVVPRINSLSDGRLVVICDRGLQKPQTEFQYLSTWVYNKQMWNELFWSYDEGLTWDGPHRIDDVGGEPEYIQELSNGSLMYTRAEVGEMEPRLRFNPATYYEFGNPAKYDWFPGVKVYYKQAAVFSDDGGQTWGRKSFMTDHPLYSDAEAGFAEIKPGHLLAVTRCADHGTRYGQPSRMIRSNDYGLTWDQGVLAPFHGHRPTLGMLQSGKALAVFRNALGTNATYAFVFDPEEPFTYQPNSFIWNEADCEIDNGIMTLRTEEGPERAVRFQLYPAQNDVSRVELETEMRLEEADEYGCCISAGCWIRFETDRVSLAGRPEQGFMLDTRKWHQYKIIREHHEIFIYVDGELLLHTNTVGLATRTVSFGNRYIQNEAKRNRSVSHWRSLSVKVINPDDYTIDWEWNAAVGYPDQFRRDRLVLLDKSGFSAGDNGYPQWVQQPDGSIVIIDYTKGEPVQDQPFVRSYTVTEAELSGLKQA